MFGCELPRLTSVSPDTGATGSLVTLIINGTDLADTTSLNLRSIETGIAINVSNLTSEPNRVVATVFINPTASIGAYDLWVTTPLGDSNSLRFSVTRGYTPGVPAEITQAQGLLKYLNPARSSLDQQSLTQSAPPGSIVLTPVADGTVQQLSLSSNQAGSSVIIKTTGPAGSIGIAGSEAANLDSVDRSPVSNFLRYGLASGGALNLNGITRLEDYSKSLPVPASGKAALSQAGFGAAGILEFDLSSLKTALQQLNVNASNVRATLRLTPIRSVNVLDFLSDLPQVETPSTTQVAILEMAQSQKNLVVDYNDFPGFTSPRVSNLENLAATINNLRAEQRATVRTDLLGLLAPLSFDVTQAVQGDLQTTTAATGFQVVSSLNGAGLIFADSSMQIPGLAELIAPQLIIELTGFTPSGQARFVTSTTRIPYDSLGQGSTDLILVTINNIGANSGAVSIDLTSGSGSNVFGLMTTDGTALNAQGNTATIAAGERLTFGVTFKPGGGENFQGELQVTDTTGGKREVVSRIALTGSSLASDFSAGLPIIAAPIKPQRLPDHAARVGDMNGDGLIDAVDVIQLSAIVGGRAPAPLAGTVAFAVADINGDHLINSADASILADALARNLDALPRLRPAAGEINIVSGPVKGSARGALAVRPRQ